MFVFRSEDNLVMRWKSFFMNDIFFYRIADKLFITKKNLLINVFEKQIFSAKETKNEI